MSEGPEDHLDLVGRILDDRYRIRSVLGAGGMGTAYLATDERLARSVVVKVPLQQLLERSHFRVRFLREIEQLIKLEHPSIVRVYDGGESEGLPYMVLQYLSGGSLSDRLKSAGTQDVETVAGWLPGLADALDFMHGMDILHRDVKPANILFDKAGHGFLADFGIAKALEDSTSTQLTLTGTLVGSPDFMAPECGYDTVDAASDQYSLGVVAYLALSGRLPHGSGKNPVTLLARKMNTRPRSLADRAPQLPKPVVDSVMRALSSRPEERFARCTEFADAFRAAGPHGGTSADSVDSAIDSSAPTVPVKKAAQAAYDRVISTTGQGPATSLPLMGDAVTGISFQIPPLLPYLNDRSVQKDELTTALHEHRAARPQRPLVVLVSGDELEAHDRFVDLLREHVLPGHLDEEPVHLLKFPWSDSTGSLLDRQRHLEHNLAESVVGRRDATREDIAAEIINHRASVLITTFVAARDWLPHEPELIGAWIESWANCPDLPHGQLFAVLLSVRYQSVSGGETGGPLGGWRRNLSHRRQRRRAARSNAAARDFVHSLDLTNVDNITAVKLSRLRGIRESHVAAWIEAELDTFCRENPRGHIDPVVLSERLKPQVRKLFRKWESRTGSHRIPMSSLAPDLRRELFKCLNEGGS